MHPRIPGFLCVLLLGAAPLPAQDFPARAVTMIVPFTAGGPTDTLARHLAQSMGSTLKQQVIVENAPGAGGTIGSAKAAKAKPDGYTILIAHIGMATAPALYRRLSFNPLTDYEYIGQVADGPMTLIAKPGFQPANLKDLIAYVKANKTKVNMGNAGIGSASHLCGLLFMSSIETDLTTVPYSGTGPAMTALMGGQIDLMCDQTTNTNAQIKAGKVKVYGVSSRQRASSLPDVPTVQEQGLKDFEVAVWHGLYAPKGTPKAALDKLNAALQAAVKDAGIKAKLAELGVVPVSADKATPESLQKHLKTEIDKWGPIIKKAGVYAD
jgi:tripartite-type tricarboxylate transporter receptor subunit TctC